MLSSLRGFGNRIARIFTRKKDRHLESPKAVNERNQKTPVDPPKLLVSPSTATDLKTAANPLTDAPVIEEQFHKCTSYSPKAENRLSKASIDSTNSELPGDHLARMEAKPKDINQLYREMEEAVAQKVRETMELADARRRALALSAQAMDMDNWKSRPREEATTSRERINNKINEDKDAIRTQEIFVDRDDHFKKEEIQQEFEGINRSIEQEQAKMHRAVEAGDEVKEAERAANETESILQIGFEYYKTTPNVEKDTSEYETHFPTQTGTTTVILNETEKAVKEDYAPEEIDDFVERNKKSQIGFEHFEDFAVNDPPYQQTYDINEFENKHDLAHIAQHASRDTENIFQEFDDDRIPAAIQINTNNPFDLIEDTDAELRRMGENALGLAETSVRNFGANPFESSDDEVEIRFGDGTISMVQNNWRNSTRNPFETIDESMEKRQLDDEALFIVQNASRNYATNPFDVLEEEEFRQMGVDALSIAQTGARNVEATKRRLSENVEDIDNAFNSLIDYADLQNPVVEIGFDHLQHTVGEIGDTDEKVTPTELKKNENLL